MNTLELSPFERGSIPNCSRPLSICIPCFHTFSSINRSSIETRSSRANRDPPSLIKIFLRMGEEWSRINEETLAFEVASITLPFIRKCLAIMKHSRETVFLEISRYDNIKVTRVNDISDTLEKTVNICVDPVRSMQMLFMEIATFEIARYMEIVEYIYIWN